MGPPNPRDLAGATEMLFFPLCVWPHSGKCEFYYQQQQQQDQVGDGPTENLPGLRCIVSARHSSALEPGGQWFP